MSVLYSPKHAYLLLKKNNQGDLSSEEIFNSIHQFLSKELSAVSTILIEHSIDEMTRAISEKKAKAVERLNEDMHQQLDVELAQSQVILQKGKHEFVGIINRRIDALKIKQKLSASNAAFNKNNVVTFQSVEQSAELSLIDDDQLEREYLKTGFLSNLMPMTQVSTNQLTLRFQALTKDLDIECQDFCFSSWYIGQAFISGVDNLALPLKSETIVYQELEQQLHAALPLLYAYINCFLVEHGVCPELPVTGINEEGKEFELKSEQREDYLSRVSNKSRIELPAHLSHALPIAAFGAAFNLISQLLDAKKGVASPNMDLSTQIKLPELVNALNDFQHSDSYEDISSQVVDFRKVIKREVSQIETVDRKAIGHSSDDMLDVVSLMFEYILKNDNISNVVRQQICRLQVPFLKLALIEPEFFKENNHPARILLNTIAKQGVAIGPKPTGSDQGVIEKITSLISTIVKDFNGDTSIFQSLNKEFMSFMEQELHKTKMIIERTKAAEIGKAKFEHAALVVEKVIDRTLDQKSLSQSVVDVIRNGIQPAAVFTYLNKGPKDADVIELVKNIRKLVLSVLTPVKKGLSLNDEQKSNLNKALETVLLDFHQDNKQVANWMSCITEQQQYAVHSQCHDQVKVEIAVEEPEESSSQIEASFLELSQNLPIGSWVDVAKENEWIRARLIARLNSSKKMLFVNRIGIKVCEFVENDFANLMQTNQIKVVKNAAVFEKALESVVVNLRSMRKEKLSA
jgi:hypothetical protein